MDAVKQVKGPKSNVLVLSIFLEEHPHATSTSSQCGMLCPGSAAASAELKTVTWSAVLKTVTCPTGEFDGALERTAGSLQEIPASGVDREVGRSPDFTG